MVKTRTLLFAFLLVAAACGRERNDLLTTTAAPLVPTPVATPSAGASPTIASSTPGRSSVTIGARTPAPARTAAAHPRSSPAPVVAGASIGGCPLFPADNAWRRDVSSDLVDPRSNAYVRSIGEGAFVHPDFGSNPDYGIPYVVVPRDQGKVRITFTEYGDESDPGPYPVPLDARIEAGSDRHVLVAQKGTCKLYELYHAERSGSGWNAGAGAVFDLRSNRQRPAGWTSADAAGLPILPGLVRRDEIKRGAILHALRFTAPRTQAGYVDPARHLASSDTDPDLPPMGLRLRLKRSYDISAFRGASRVVLEALKTYGMILADNGSSFYVSGANDTGWDDDDLEQLKRVPGSAFEALEHGTIHR
jgi:hypothetical protein